MLCSRYFDLQDVYLVFFAGHKQVLEVGSWGEWFMTQGAFTLGKPRCPATPALYVAKPALLEGRL
jgi:hypothetical protein